MNFPSLTTDSFYKFTTVLGLVLIAVSINFFTKQFAENRNTNIKYGFDSIQTQIRIKDLELDLKSLQSKIAKGDSIRFANNLLASIDSNNLKQLVKVEKIKNQISLGEMMIKKSRLEKDDSNWYLKFGGTFYIFLFLMALFGLISGVVDWRNHQQQFHDKELLRKYIDLGRIAMICNSCCCSLSKDSVRPKEKDGSYNYLYCTSCYHMGEFREPALTLSEMKERIGKMKLNWFGKWFRLHFIDSRERWKEQRFVHEEAKTQVTEFVQQPSVELTTQKV